MYNLGTAARKSVKPRDRMFPAARGCCIVAVLLLSAATSASTYTPVLSGDEQRRVDAGAIVVLDVLPPGASASAQGGTAVALVCASPADVWAIVADWPGHTRLYPRITAAEVVSSDVSRVRVHYTVGIGPFSFQAFIDKFPDPEHRRSTWHLAEDESNTLFSESIGYWQIDAAGAGSQVTHGVGTRTIVPAFLTRGSQRQSLITTVQNLRMRAQGNDGTCTGSAH